jgi:DNA end-binding protein Ku
MARAYWKGYLKLSLVSCPIALNPATSESERVSFRQINKKTGNRLRQQLVDEGTREVVDAADKGKGYEIAKGVYIPVDDEEIEAIQIESKHTIEIDSFVPAAQIDKRYYDSPYYIMPNDNVGQEAFAVIRDAMRGKSMVALGRVVLSKRERVIAIEPHGKGLIGTTLRYPYEVRKESEYFDDIADIKIAPDMLQMAEHIIKQKQADFDPTHFEDHYETAVNELLKEKQAGFKPPKGKAQVSAAPNVINLMDALRRSIQSGSGKAEPKKSEPKKGKRAAGQTEMLLPIAGKKAGRESAPATKQTAPGKKSNARRKAG